MKRIFYLIIGLVLLTSFKAEPEILELNLTKGDTYNQIMASNIKIYQVYNGQQLVTNMSINAKMTYKVIDIKEDIYDIEVRYESLMMKMSNQNGEVEFSSEKNDEDDIFSTLLGTMKNKPFLIKMTKTGKVNEVKNIDVLFSMISEKFPLLSEEQKTQVQNQLKNAYGEKAFKGNIEMSSAIFPGTHVSTGDKWKISTQLESGMSAKMETVYQLKDISDNYYQIVGHSNIKTADKDAYIETNGMPLKYDLSGVMISDIKIDKKTGWTINAIITQSIDGTAYVKENPLMPDGMIIGMVMKNEMTISDK